MMPGPEMWYRWLSLLKILVFHTEPLIWVPDAVRFQFSILLVWEGSRRWLPWSAMALCLGWDHLHGTPEWCTGSCGYLGNNQCVEECFCLFLSLSLCHIAFQINTQILFKKKKKNYEDFCSGHPDFFLCNPSSCHIKESQKPFHGRKASSCKRGHTH